MSMTDLATLARDIRILKDIEEIKRLKHRYFRCIDMANLEELATLLHPDVTVDFVGGTYRFQLTGAAEYVRMIGEAFHADFVGQHNGHHPEIDVLSETEATGLWYLSDVALNLRSMVSTIGSALYRDRYVRLDGVWKIRTTQYERIFEIVEPIEKRPNLTAHWLGLHGKKLG
jgi:bile-acid 7alpha-dehydratase